MCSVQLVLSSAFILSLLILGVRIDNSSFREDPGSVKSNNKSVANKPSLQTQQQFCKHDQSPRLPVVLPKRRFLGHTKPITSLAFSVDGKLLLSGSADCTIRVFEVSTGREIQCFRGHTKPIVDAVFSPNGKWVLSASSDRTIRLWDFKSGYQKACFFGYQGSFCNLAFLSDDQKILSASTSSTICLWDVPSKEKVQCFQGHTLPIYNLAVSLDNQFVASSSFDNTIRIWNMKTNRETFRIETEDDVPEMLFSQKEACLLVYCSDGSVTGYDLMNWKKKFFWHSPQEVRCVFSPCSDLVLTTRNDGIGRLWSLAEGIELCHFSGHRDLITGLAFSPDGSFCAGGGGYSYRQNRGDSSICLWEIPTQFLKTVGLNQRKRKYAIK